MFCTLIIAAATVIYTCFARLQWTAMIGQLDEMKSASTQNELAIKRELRPYISVNKMEMLGELTNGRSIKGHAEMINAGRTPGTSVQGCADIALLPNSRPMTDDFPCPATNNPKRLGAEISRFNLGAGAPFGVDSPGTTISPVGTLLPLLTSGALRLYFYGELSYEDTLDPKDIHHTTFCGRYNVQSHTLEICEKHNRMH